MAEYRLDDLARVSGVSARNIRAYRERGLLDPPRRQGRSAYYDDYHLAQLETINQLLGRGFNSTHIAEFFQSIREGTELADILGLRRVVPGRRPEQAGAKPPVPGLDLDPDSDLARRLLDRGLVGVVEGTVVLVDRAMGEIVAQSPDPLGYLNAILRFSDATGQTIDELATVVVKVLEDSITSRFGRNHLPKPEQVSELSGTVQDYRDLAGKVVTDHLDKALQRRMVSAVPDDTVGLLLSGQWERNST